MPTISPTILGNRLPINLPEPQQVGSSSWTQVQANNSFTVGIDSTNKLYAWGLNAAYQVGDGTTLNKSTPVQISTSSFLVVSAGFDHSVAITNDNRLFTWGNQPSIMTLTSTSSWTLLSTSGNHSLAIRDDGTLWTWGLNNAGQLGDNSTLNKSSPVQIGSGSWASVKAGPSHSIAVSSTGQLFTWGHNNAGQVGDSTTINKSSPVLVTVSGTSSWTQVSAGNSYSSAIDSNGKLFTWGLNQAFQLGDSTSVNKSSPTQISVGTSWTTVSSGFDHSTAIDTVGTLYVWGNFNSVFAPIPTTIYSWSQLSAGALHTAGIRVDNTLWIWGTNAQGQLGQNNVISRSSPVQVTSSSFTLVSGKYSHTAAIKADSTMLVWGLNNTGQLGDGTTINKSSPVTLASGFNTSSFTLVTTGLSNTAAIKSDGSLLIWGDNSSGQLGIGNIVNFSSPTQVSGSWSQVDIGTNFTVTKRVDGTIWSWGTNTTGQLGIATALRPGGDTINRSSPVLAASGSWLQLSTGFDHTLAIRSDNTLWTWGNGLAIGLVTEPTSWLNVSAGNTHSLGIRDNGSLWAWGVNGQGQIGDLTVVSKSSPVNIAAGSWSAITAGNSLSLAISSTGLLYAWGLNASGQVGDNTSLNKSSPVQIGTSSWILAQAGFDHVNAIDSQGRLFGWGQYTTGQTGVYDEIYSWSQLGYGIGLRTNNTLWTWGLNSSGQIGDNTTINKSSPVQIGSNDWSSITLTYTTSSIKGAIKTNGTLYMWGSNNQGQLGLGDTINRSSPTQITGSWNQISVQQLHTAARNSSNIIYTWGFNETGELGDGTTINKSSPVLLASPFNTTSWTSVSVGFSYTTALRSDNIIYTWGSGNSGRLGTGLTTNRSNPVTLGGAFATSSFVAVSAGALHALALRTDFRLVAWGDASNGGQLGDGTTINKSTPVLVGTSSWTNVTANRLNNLGVIITGALFFWGADLGSGESGLNATLNRSAPTQIGALTTWSTAMIVGAINNTGSLFTWGSDNINLFDTTISTSSPIQVGGFYWPPQKYFSPQQVGSSSWTTVSSGSSYTVGIATNNLLYGWGLNTSGQLGDTTTISKSSPVQLGAFSYNAVSAGFDHVLAIRNDTTLWTWGNSAAISLLVQPTSWSQLSNGYSHSLAIRSDGALFAWGIGTSGQLGNNASLSYSSPVQIGNSSWTTISAGNNFSLGIDINNRLYTWGLGTSGQLGLNVATSRSNPTQIDSSSYTLISAGDTHAFAITTDNKLFGWGTNNVGQILPFGSYTLTGYSTFSIGSGVTAAIRNVNGALLVWGNNTAGQLGQGDTINRSNPTQIGINSWKQVSAASSVVMAIRSDDTLWTWGLNTSGQLGDGSIVNKSSPVQVAGSWSKISAGTTTSAGIKTDSTLWLWGNGVNGELGDGSNVSKSSPVQVSIGGSWNSVSVGNSFALGTTTANIVYAWGLNTSGQLGDGTTVNKNVPTLLASPFNTTSFSQVSAGGSHSLGLTSTGLLYSWGGGSVGELGTGLVNRSNPTQVTGLPLLSTSYTLVYAGGQVSGAINENNLYVWGINTGGILGTGDTINRSFPTQIGIGYNWTNIGIDNLNTLGSGFLRSDNSLWLTGNNSSGNLGNNTTINRSTPVIVGSVASISAPIQIGTSSWTAISAGSSFSIGINSSGQLYTWGINNVNQIGNNSTVEENDNSYQIAGSWTKVSAGLNHSLAIKSDSTLWTWGSSSAILLSNVTPLSWTTIASGGAASHVAAIKSDGTIWTWGLNTNGQLGDGTTINKSSPTQLGLGTYSQVAVDISNTIAIRTGGNLFIWGGNSSGQLGDGTTINRSSPVQLDSNSWSQIGINTSHAAAIRNNLLFVWGNNASGQLGDNTTINKSSPVQITGSWNSISAGAQYTIATNNLSLLFAWGNNAAFQLGDNTTINKSSPIQIASGVSFTSISAGPTHSVAIDSLSKIWTWGQGSSIGIDVNSWTQLAFGNGFGLATRSDYKLFGWGRNDVGQLGLNDTINRSSPVLVSSGSWTAIAAAHAGNYASGITSDGKLFTWGQNSNGTLGDGTTINKSSPIQISVGSSFTLVSAGQLALFAVTVSPAFALFANGNAGNGALGDGTTINKSTPVQITNPSTSWTFISAGVGYGGAINNLGKLYMWGVNSGYLGLGDTINRSTPTIISGATSWLAVSAGGTVSLAIDSTNKLWAWGWSNAGQLGDGTTINKSSPVQLGSSSWSQVATNDSTSMAIRSDNTVWTWGLNSSGQLGDSTTINKSSPVQVAGNFSSITISGNNSMGAIATGNLFKNKIFTWGNNTFNVLGLGNQINRSSPTLLFSTTGTVIPTQMLSYQSFSQVSAGISYTLAERANDNVVMAWGLNTVGNYGDNTLTQPTLSNPVIVGQNNQIDNSNNSFVPNTINGAPKIVDFSPFANSPYNAVTYGGSMQFSGNPDYISYAANTAFTFGTGNFTVEFWLYAPYQLNSFLVDFRNGANASYPMITTGVSTAALRYVGATGTLTGTVIIADNNWHHCAVTRESNTVKMWIDGVLDGTLADASNYSINSSVFFGVSSFLSPPFRLSGYLSNVRIVKGQALYTNTFTPSTTPLTTSSQGATEANVSLLCFQGFPTAYSSIGVLGQTSGFGMSTGELYMTGLGTSGQQGDGTTINKSNPIQLGSVFTGLNTGTYIPIKVNDNAYSQISAGTSFSLALGIDNLLYAWGLNSSGQFGLNLVTNRSSPVQVGTLNQTFVDNSTFGYTLTYGGSTQMVVLSPFASGSYDVSIYGASQLFNGSPDYLELSYNTAGSTLQFGTNDFTIECWFYGTNVGLGSTGRTVIQYGQYVTEYGVVIDTFLGDVRFLVMNLGSTGRSFIGTKQSVNNNTWYHAAIVKRSGVFYSYLNGTQVGTNSNYSSISFDSTLGFRIGCGTGVSSTNPAYYFSGGYISNVRVVKGVGVYTGNFTVPTLPLSATQSSGTNINAITGTQTTLLTGKTINQTNVPSYTKFSAGAAYTSVINSIDSLLYNWGLNTSGQLGINDAISRSSPVLLGNNQMINTYTNSPVQVTPGTSGYTQIFAGQSFSVAKRSDDSLYAWGLNTSGQLGLNTATSRSSPTSFGTSSFTAVSAGYTHLMIVNATDNRLYATGLGSSGQLGIGNLTSRSSPTIVGNGQVVNTGTLSPIQIIFGLPNSWVAVSAGQSFSMAKDVAGSVYAWGVNDSGQLDSSSTINRSSPTQITGSFNLIAAGLTHVVTTYSDSTLYTWGLGTSGQLGDNTAVSKSSPVLIGNQFNTNTISPILVASASWTSTSAGTSHSLAIKNDGSLYAWGLNNVGQLGQSDTINRSSIVQIGSGVAPFIDSSSNAFTLTSNNNAFMIAVSPFISGTYDTSVYGGSGSFSGADPYVTTSNNSAFDLPGDFTLECWVYFNTGTLTVNRLIFDRWTLAVSGSYQLYFRSIGTSITFLVDSSTVLLQDPSPSRIAVNTWYHIAIVRNGSGSNNMSMYINGTSVVSNTYTGNLTSSNAVYIGIQGSTLTNDFDGYISNLRLVKGTAVYTGNFTPATTPLTNISGTSLLTCLYSDFSNTYSLITAGTSTSMAIKANNLLFAWGLNTTGQLGLNVATNRSAPIQVTTSSWSQITTGLTTTLGINSDNNLYAWGGTATGQFGMSVTTPNRSSPTIVQGINYETKSPTLVDGGYDDANAGNSHTAAVSSGSLYVWGLNNVGQLGLSDIVNRSSPTLVGSLFSITDFSPNAYAITLGGGAPIETEIVPFVDDSFSVALNINVSGGQQGNVDQLRFTTALTTQIANYANYTIEFWMYRTGFASDAYLFTIGVGGSATYGRFYIETSDNSLRYSKGTGGWSWSLADLVSSGPNITETNVWRHVALVKEGSAASIFYNGTRVAYDATSSFSTYSNTNFYIGSYFGDYNNQGNYFKGYLSNFRMVSSALYSGTTYTIPTSPFAVIANTQLLTIASVTGSIIYDKVIAGTGTTFAITDKNNLFAWGLGTTGQISGYHQAISRSSPNQIGNNFINVSPSSPVQIAAGSWSKVAAGNSISAAIRSDGLLFTWGSLNAQGQLGDGTLIAKSSPVQIGDSSWTQISIYFNHMAALTSTNGMYVWGLNNAGQLGDGTTVDKVSPIQVGNSSWTNISAGNSFTAGITSDNILFAWGFGTSGQLGYGTAANRSSPVQIGNSSWTLVAAGNSHASAIRSDGATFNWGLGTSGQLGRAYSSISRSSPVQVGLEYPTGDVYVPTKIDGTLLSTSWTKVSSGASYTSAIKNNNTLYAWGLNNIGQLGDNSTINKSSPSQVGTATYNDVSSGNSFTLGIAKNYPTSN